MKTLLILSAFFSASFQKIWAQDQEMNLSGSGVLTQKAIFAPINKQEPCESIKINLILLDAKLIIKKYNAACGLIQPDWGPEEFSIQNGKVFNDGDEVGTYDGRIFLATVVSGGVQYAYNFEFKRDNQNLIQTVRSYYGVKNLVGVIVIEGELKPTAH